MSRWYRSVGSGPRLSGGESFEGAARSVTATARGSSPVADVPAWSRGRDEPLDGALVRAAQAGDAAAYGELYERHRDAVYRYCLARTGVEHDAEDLVSEVFLRAMESLQRYTERGVPFLAFLYRVARNAAIDRARQRRDEVSVETLIVHPPARQNVEAEALRAQRRAALVAALARLKPDYREVLLLRFVEGYPAAEAGRLLGKDERAIRNLQHRGLERLRRELGRAKAAELFSLEEVAT